MDTQNTPVHIKLWHREFWLMAIANLLITMSVYMLIPAIPPHMFLGGFSPIQTALAMGVFGVGIFAFGPSVSYYIQKYRRNKVCIYSILGVDVTILLLNYLDKFVPAQYCFYAILVIRFLMGAFYGLSQMTLSSTLIIDTCESFQRTEANHIAAWFSRFALSFGPLLSLGVFQLSHSYNIVLFSAIALSLIAICLINMIKFPFKAPSENMKRFCFDRFFMPQGMWLFFNLILITTVIGLMISLPRSDMFFGMIFIGFVLALLAEKFAFANADLKSEVITGIISMGAAILIHYYARNISGIVFVAPVLIGFGIGIIGSRFLLFFIKLADHCQRGTSHSTFFLGWETGIAIGLFVGIGLLRQPVLTATESEIQLIDNQQVKLTMIVSLILLVVSLSIYNMFVHNWYVKNKNR